MVLFSFVHGPEGEKQVKVIVVFLESVIYSQFEAVSDFKEQSFMFSIC